MIVKFIEIKVEMARHPKEKARGWKKIIKGQTYLNTNWISQLNPLESKIFI